MLEDSEGLQGGRFCSLPVAGLSGRADGPGPEFPFFVTNPFSDRAPALLALDLARGLEASGVEVYHCYSVACDCIHEAKQWFA